ncbi:MAG: ATP synthase F0 subunit A [Actinobacteria bacterium HGW-Actinobacteria-2]|nr:MAG: ATP synthase F0 subunit A [Actinobacteria bacterium HGW-Actinobacteria-2]
MPGLIGLLIPLEWTACAAEESHSEGFAPGVSSFCARPLFPELGEQFAWLNNVLAQAVIGAILVIAFWLWVSRRQQVVPGRRQFFGELAYNFIRNGIARDMLGHDYRKFLPYLVALFSFILVNNLFGQFFLFMFPTFSKIGYAWALAGFTFLLYNGVGIYKHGFFKYLKNNTIPAGVPAWIYPLIVPLEFLSNFVIRPITLGLRLFANLFGGHLVILVFVVGGTLLLTTTEELAGKPIWLLQTAGGFSLVFSFALFALELFVSVMQAYIFTVLTAQYVATALADEH